MKKLVYLMLLLCLAGCLPVGIKASNLPLAAHVATIAIE